MITVLFTRAATRSGFLTPLILVGRPRDYFDVGDGCQRRNLLVTVLEILVTSIHYFFTLASGTNIQNMSPRLKFCHQNSKIATNSSHQHRCCHQALISFSLSSKFRPKKIRTGCIFREQDCTYEYIIIYFFQICKSPALGSIYEFNTI